MSQIVERFEAAVAALVADGPVKTRLGQAYTGFIEDLQQVDLPVAGKHDLAGLHAAMHRAAAVGTVGPVAASVAKMSPAEAWRHARTIVRIYTEVLAMERDARGQTEARVDAVLAEEAEAEEALPPRYLASGN